jgi:hypothetical protein
MVQTQHSKRVNNHALDFQQCSLGLSESNNSAALGAQRSSGCVTGGTVFLPSEAIKA